MSDRGGRQKIGFAMTIPSALRSFMADHIRVLAGLYDVTVFCNFEKDPCRDLFDPSVTLVHIPFERAIRPWQDFKTLVQLYRALYGAQFVSIHSIMPKTGLLSMTAGWLAGIPIRIHMFTGQVWVTRRGAGRLLLKALDRLMANLATDIYADSLSQRDFLVKEGIIKSGRVLASGSVNGVDCERFRPDPEARKAVRQAHGIAANTLVYGFLGRLTRDKGLYDLIEAFAGSPLRERACLLLVGPDEGAIEEAIRKRFPDLSGRVHFAGYTATPEHYYAAFDVFCLPSYREGFGSSVIEAAACGVPALASRIYGLEDAVEEGITGILHAPKNVAEIRGGLERYAAEPRLMRQYGAAARRRAKSVFSRERLVRAMTSEYERLLSRGSASV